MGKTRRRRVSKSQAVRDHLTENPNAAPLEVVAAMKAKRIRVSPQMVSSVKWKMQREGKTPSSRRNQRNGKHSRGMVSVDHLLAAKGLVDRLGGFAQAQHAIAVLAKLQ
jgi:hypothetical protein